VSGRGRRGRLGRGGLRMQCGPKAVTGSTYLRQACGQEASISSQREAVTGTALLQGLGCFLSADISNQPPALSCFLVLAHLLTRTPLPSAAT
jgi:hypothetical protein